MTPHLLILLWVILSQCSTGDTKRELVMKLGERCDSIRKCGGINLVCNMTVKECHCHRDYPIVTTTNIKTLCLQPSKLGMECLHTDSCLATDKFSDCTQMGNSASCKCKEEYYEIYDKNTQSVRCVPEGQLLNSDLATLLGVGAGMTLFCGLTCLILRLFARARFGPRHHHYANAHLAPPITLSTDHDRGGGASRHSSQRSSTGGSRRPSLLAPPGRQPDGSSRRASNTSIRSNASARSFSLKQHSNHHHYHQHRPSDPEAGLSLPNANLSSSKPNSDTNIASTTSGHHQKPQDLLHSPNKAKRSGSAGNI